MANFETALTDAICASAAPERREYAIRDARQRNLSLRVRPGGSKTWIVRHLVGNSPARVSIGQYPAVDLKAARKTASAIISGQSAPPPDKTLFGVFCGEHDTRHGVALKPSGRRTYRSYVRTQLLPTFGHIPLARISRVDIVRWFERYSVTSPGGANRALGILGQMLESAREWNRMPVGWTNPVSGVRHNRRRTRGTFLSKDQMARLGTALAARSKSDCMGPHALIAAMLTGCRVGEIICLTWGEVLTDRLRLRDSKTGARDVPLGTSARRFFAAHRRKHTSRHRSSDAVFPFADLDGYERIRTVWKAARKEAGLPDRLRIHDLRHSFASHAIMSGESLFAVSRLLGHKRVQTTARYAHLADDTMSANAERIGVLIMAQAQPRAIRAQRTSSRPSNRDGGES